MTMNTKIFITVVIGGVVSGLAFYVFDEIERKKLEKTYAEIDSEWDKFVNDVFAKPDLTFKGES